MNPKIWKAQLWLLTKGVIRRLVLLITKRLIDQDLQIVITRITYGALTARSLDIHGRNAGNFMVRQPHLAKGGATMEGSKGIIFFFDRKRQRDILIEKMSIREG